MRRYSFNGYRVFCIVTLAVSLFSPADANAQKTLLLNPYRDVDWEHVEHYKTNLHTHSTQSDGRLTPAQVIDEYRDRGYKALALTDHDRCTFPWSKFGRDAAEAGMLAIPGNELSRHHHTLSLFCDYVTQTREWETALAGVGEAGGVAVIAHPAMHWPRDRRLAPALEVKLSAPFRRLTRGDFTLEAWFRTTDAGRNILMGNFAAGRAGALNLELHTDNRVRVFLAPADQGQTVDLNVAADSLDIDTRDGRWHHLAAVRRGDSVLLYLDGREVGKRPDTAGAFELPGDVFYIGRDTRTGTTVFSGDLDHVRLWRRALSAEEISSVRRGNPLEEGAGPSTEDLLARYTFDQFADARLEPGTAVTGRAEDSANHPEGPFHADVTGRGAPVIIAEVPEVLEHGGKSRAALRFETTRYEGTGVPDDVVEQYAGLFARYPHLLGQEVLNGTRPLEEYPLDRGLWDKLLTRLMPKRPVWGFATDDMHGMAHLGRDWLWVPASKLDETAVRDAITQGAFYFASIRLHDADRQSVEGTPRIERIDHDAENGTITIKATEDGRLLPDDAYQWFANGEMVHVGPTLAYRATCGIGVYVRAEITGSGGTIFTNPFGFDDP